MIKKKPFKVSSNIDVVSVEKNLVRISVLKNNFKKIACLQDVILLKVKSKTNILRGFFGKFKNSDIEKHVRVAAPNKFLFISYDVSKM